jgi:hypothetical protein
MQEEEAERENREPDHDEETETGSKRSRDDLESEEEVSSSPKRVKVVNTSKFPWLKRRTEALASLPVDIRETYQQLKNFAADPKSIVTDILSTPGCPPFPQESGLMSCGGNMSTLVKCSTLPTQLN